MAVAEAVAEYAAPAAVAVDDVDLGSREEANKALVRRFVEELWNRARLHVADEIVDVECVPHPMQYGTTRLEGRAGPRHLQVIIAGWRRAFPDWHISITDLIAEGDKVVLVSTGTGTHRGELMGIKPTGRRVTFTGMRVFRIAHAKIVEYWVLWDWDGLWQQLGRRPR